MTLTVHLIPTAVARGAQVYARALADQLDLPASPHRLLCLFDGPEEVKVDEWLGCRGGKSPGEGLDPRVAIRLRSRLRAMGPGAVVAHGGDALKYAVWSCGPVPLVYYAIGTLSGGARHGLRLAQWRFMVGRAAVVAVVSDDVADECRSVLGVSSERLVVIPNGRDPDRFQPRAAYGAQGDALPVVLFLGRMIPGKRPELFVRLVGELRSRGVKLRAKAVGDGPLLQVLEHSAARAGVELSGPSGDVGEVLRGADLLVFSSAPEGEGMPGVLIEAGLSGLPVVATGVAGVASVVANGETGLVVGVEDFDALVGATAELLGNPARRLVMGRAAHERCVERFSLRASARGWQELLDRLAAAN